MGPDTSQAEIEQLWQAVARSGARSLAVVAARSGEGATSLAEALTRRAALGGSRALCVDLSGAKHGLGAAPDAILPGDHEGIGVLSNPSPASVLAWRDPARLGAQIAEWLGAWDHVVLDAAPLLAPGEGVPPLSAAAAAEGTILVVLAGRTAASDVREAHHRLERARARLLGAVLNDRENPSLLSELEREAERLDRVAPGLVQRIKGGLRRSSLLRQRT